MKFSVIVPVYNAEKHLEKCILSVIQQNYDNWELILVNDGSTDNSSNIIEEYTKVDSRIIPIHQRNGGPGNARNNGISRATGDYVIFLDSDDFIDADYFNLLLAKVEHADVIFIDVLQISSDGKILRKELMSRYKGWCKDKIIRSQMTGKIPWGGVRKIVKRSLLVDNHIKYTNHKVGEEALYSFQVVYYAQSVDFLDEKPVYYYVNHEGSQSKTALDNPWGGVVDTMANHLKVNGLYEEFGDTLNAFLITATIVAIDKINLHYKGKEKKKHLEKCMNNFREKYDKSVPIDNESMSMKAKIFVPFITKGIVWPVVLSSMLKNLI